MKPSNSLRLLLAAGLSVGLLPQAFAATTASGTTVANTASVAFDVGGVPQTPVNSNTSTFVVDSKVSVLVQGSVATSSSVPGATNQAVAFTVTNQSNTPMDFALTAANQTGDNFQVSALQIYRESGDAPGFDAQDVLVTYLDELAPDTPVTVYVTSTIPLTATNTQFGLVSLTATAAQSVNGTGNYVATPGSLAANAVQSNVGVADDTTYVDTVFADAAGTATGDAAYDGKHSANGRYNVATATITVSKSSVVVTDPINCATAGVPGSCTSAPKAIPGAVIEYCLDVNNTGASAADGIVLTDAIPANTTYVASTIRTGATSATSDAICDVGSGALQGDATGDSDSGDFLATPAPRGSVEIRSTQIPATSRFRAVFRVTVD